MEARARRLTLALLIGIAGPSLTSCGSDNSTSGPEAPSPPSALHLYPAYGVSASVSCSRTRIKVVYFVPRGEEAHALPTWRAEASSRFTLIKEFYEREFSGQISLRFDVAPRFVVARNPTYSSGADVKGEIESVLFTPGGSYYDPAFVAEEAGEYVVRMIYYLNLSDGKPVDLPGGGAWPWDKFAINPAFWLDSAEQGASDSGTLGSAHEFGHLLGIPHPWEMNPAQADTAGNIMGYSTSGLTLLQCYVADDVKLAMGMRK